MATKARLHWFWRGAIAAAAGVGAAVLLSLQLVPGYNWLVDLVSPVTNVIIYLSGDFNGNTTQLVLHFALPCILVALTTYGLLARYCGPVSTDGEPHCRRCQHILRGLSEPRCPECGEAI